MNSPLAMLVAVTGVLFLLYLLVYATYLFLSVALGAWRLYHQDKMVASRHELKHEFYVPGSLRVPARYASPRECAWKRGASSLTTYRAVCS